MKLLIEYKATFIATIEVPDNPTQEDIDTEIDYLEIPTGGRNNSEYQLDTFKILNTKRPKKTGHDDEYVDLSTL